jgi:pSer/pThr/pTyr-binding forkhead associated (FHA) protein
VGVFQILVHDKEGRRTVRAFDQDRVSIGRAPENDVVLADASVSKAHAVLEREGARFRVQDLGSTNGVFVDGERALGGEPAVVEPGMVIGIGDFSLTLSRLDEEPAQTFRIGVTEPSGRHHVFAVSGEEVTIGADAGCDLQLEGDGVAPRHTRVVIQSDRLVLADLKSPSGTWKNDERLTAPQVVHEGDLVRVGCFHLSFARPGRAGPLAAPPVSRAGEDRTLPTAEPDEAPASSSPPASKPPEGGDEP